MASAASVSGIELGPRASALALAFYVVATLLAFPHEWPGGGTFDLGLFFAWLVPGALALGLTGRAPRDAVRMAFAASLVAHFLVFHWFFVVTVTYGGLSPWIGVFAPLVPALYVSVFSAVFAFGWVQIRDRGAAAILFGAALWAAVDLMRAHFLGGFPWATLGYALHLDVPLMSFTRETGVYGLSFAAAAVGLAIARALTLGRTRTLVVVVLGVAVLHGVGAYRVGDEVAARADAASPSNRQRPIQIAAVQGNVDQGQKWDEARRTLIFEKYMGLSERAVREGAEWILWPETAVPGFIELDPLLAGRLRDFARRHGVALIVGGMGAELDSTRTRIGKLFDSAFVFDRDGRLVDRYDKAHLVPFGEYVPLRSLFGRFFKALATGLTSSDLTPGDGPRVVDWVDGDGTDDRPRVAVPICYELLFPHLMRGFGADGADLMLAMTNDAWYGRTGAPHQFLAMTSMRAAENGRFIVRAANTGISAIIDDHGRVQQKSALFEDAFVLGKLPIRDRRPATFYARFGDVFALCCGGVALWGVGVAIRQGRARERHGAAGDARPSPGEGVER